MVGANKDLSQNYLTKQFRISHIIKVRKVVNLFTKKIPDLFIRLRNACRKSGKLLGTVVEDC